ncbi:MAG: hypothetical protein ACYCSN_21040 [Acidobacteriaceae bacterium]
MSGTLNQLNVIDSIPRLQGRLSIFGRGSCLYVDWIELQSGAAFWPRQIISM